MKAVLSAATVVSEDGLYSTKEVSMYIDSNANNYIRITCSNE